MRKLSLSILAFLFVFTALNARPRDKQEALEIANRFFAKTTQSSGLQKASSTEKSIRLLYSKTTKNSSGEALLYVFSKNEDTGFVIVSGDDRAREVLGYSDTNSFDPQNIPDNMKDWLSFYEAEIQQLKSSNQSTSGSAFIQKVGNSASLENSFATSVAPLLGA